MYPDTKVLNYLQDEFVAIIIKNISNNSITKTIKNNQERKYVFLSYNLRLLFLKKMFFRKSSLSFIIIPNSSFSSNWTSAGSYFSTLNLNILLGSKFSFVVFPSTYFPCVFQKCPPSSLFLQIVNPFYCSSDYKSNIQKTKTFKKMVINPPLLLPIPYLTNVWSYVYLARSSWCSDRFLSEITINIIQAFNYGDDIQIST